MQKSLIGALAKALMATCVAAQQYFPIAALSSDKKMDEIRSDWYSQELRSLHEVPLWRQSQRGDETAYRFLWLRAFHAPVCVHLNIERGSASITFKEGRFHGVAEPGKLLRTRTTTVTPDQLDAFLKKVAELHFWNTPSPNNNFGGPDGSEWVLEGSDVGHYKVLTAYAPPNDTLVRVLGLMLLLDLAHARIPSNLIY